MAKKRMCKHCKKWNDDFIKTNVATFCNVDCAYEFAIGKQEKEQARLIAKLKQIGIKKDKAAKKAHREDRERLKTVGDYIKEAQAAVNKYIRMRDYGKPCICCNAQMNWHKQGGAVDAGHYRSRGAASHLRFNLLNIHAQSVKCNRFLSGNSVDYRINLIKKIGRPAVERLESDNKIKKFTIDYLKRIKKIFNRRARFYAKLRGL